MAVDQDRASRPAVVPRDLARQRDLAVSLVLLWLSGACLRVTILALPPVLPRITAEFSLHATDIGLLAGLPSLLFALTAVTGAALIIRFGAVSTLVTGLLLNAIGATARGFAGNVSGLDAATVLMCLGVAVMQPALPSLVKVWAPTRIGFATATYTNGLLVGGDRTRQLGASIGAAPGRRWLARLAGGLGAAGAADRAVGGRPGPPAESR